MDEQEFDDGFPDGVFAEPHNGEPRVRIHKLINYCRERGIRLSDVRFLPPDVMEQFLFRAVESSATPEKGDMEAD